MKLFKYITQEHTYSKDWVNLWQFECFFGIELFKYNCHNHHHDLMASLAFGLWGIWKTTNPTKLVKIRFQHSTFKYDVTKCMYLIMMMMMAMMIIQIQISEEYHIPWFLRLSNNLGSFVTVILEVLKNCWAMSSVLPRSSYFEREMNVETQSFHGFCDGRTSTHARAGIRYSSS